MATPGELVAAIADAFGLTPATVVEHDRNLVTAGLRTKGGRGRSAPQTTARDAAHLVVALLGSELIQHSTHSVLRYSATVANADRSTPRLYAGCGIKELEALPAPHSFVDAVEELLTSLLSGGLSSARPAASIEIGALSPGTLADIRISGLTRHARSVRYLLPDPFAGGRSPGTAELRAWEATVRQYRVESHFKVYRSISDDAVFRLASRLRR